MSEQPNSKPTGWTARSGVVLDFDPLSTTGQGNFVKTVTDKGTPRLGTNVELTKLPVMQTDVPRNKFLQPINFDAAIKQMFANSSNSILMSESVSNSHMGNTNTDANLDLLEQQQAMEQARLLQRFKELRQMQINQQEMLMKQQQQQLEMLRKEQESIQTVIVKNRDAKWGGKINHSENTQTRTPPPSQRSHNYSNNSNDIAQKLAQTMMTNGHNQVNPPQQTSVKGQLPMPVMYVPLDEETDEILTNPDLFSDTNSRVSSQADDGLSRFPDSVSETEVKIHSQKESHCGNTQKQSTRQSDDVETDEGIGTQSFNYRSPVEMEAHQQDDNSDYSMEQERGSNEGELLEEGSIEDTKEEEDMFDPDERPIVVKKTFEELLEEQLKAEEEKVTQQQMVNRETESPKRQFLKKGEGIARFGVTGSAGPLKINAKSTLPPGARVVPKQQKTQCTDHDRGPSTDEPHKSKQPQKNLCMKKASKITQPPKAPVKKATQSRLDNAKHHLNTKVSKHETQQATSVSVKYETQQSSAMFEQDSMGTNNFKPLNLIKGQSKNSQSINNEQNMYRDKVETLNENTSAEKPLESFRMYQDIQKNEVLGKIPKLGVKPGNVCMTAAPNSMPDDASFVGRLRERELNEELEKDDLEEFELLEDLADNISYCSNASLVVRKMEERAKETKHSQSPRTSVAQQLAATLKKDSDASQQKDFVKEVSHPPVINIPQPLSCVTEVEEEEQEQEGETESETETSESESDEESEDSELDEESIKAIDKIIQRGRTDTVNNIPYQGHQSASNSGESTDEDVPVSPTKIMTRKIASKEDKNTLNTVSTLLQKLKGNSSVPMNTSNISLDTSAFAPQAKSPIVISREVITSGASLPQQTFEKTDDEKSDDGFEIHGKFSSHKQSVVSDTDDTTGNESDGSLTSYSDLKIIPKSQDYGARLNDSIGKTGTQNSGFDDEEEWGETTLKARSPGHSDCEENKADENSTPPTSKLMTKLFPKLKPQQTKKEIQEQKKLQTINNTATSDGIQSKILRDKLAELEKEIEKFRSENLNLDKLRREREEGLAKLKKEIADFEKEKDNELRRIQEYKTEETKKLRHEKKMFEKYQKAARNLPDKKEREEIETLKEQLSDLHEEMKRKESRWISSNTRLKGKIEQLEQENSELKEELKLMEKKRLEWLQKEQQMKLQQGIKQKTKSIVPPEGTVTTRTSADFQNTDSEEEKDPVRDIPAIRPSQALSSTASSQFSFRSTQTKSQVSVRGPGPPNTKQMSASSNPNKHKPPLEASGNQNLQHKPYPPSSKFSYQSNQSIKSNFSQSSISYSAKPEQSDVRTSLTEDVPRGQPIVSAMPQDTSMYTDTEGENSYLVPRKTASKFTIDRSVIDKGDKGYEENQHPDGKIERVYSTGAREILFSNGTRKEISADGKSIVVSFFNGDIKQIMADQRVVYYYAEAQTTHSTYPDGLEILQFPNNQVEKHYPEGTKEIIFPDQTIKYLFLNGSEESIFPDGTVIRVDKTGDKTMEFPNGQREIHTQEYKRREYPDGTVKTVYPDGRQETRYSNGRIRVKDRDGNVIIDRRC